MMRLSISLFAALLLLGAAVPGAWAQDGKIIHDAEFEILLKQHGERWAAEDKDLDARLDAYAKKHGKRPNILHILWDDMRYGAIGHRMFTDITGYKAPNIEKIAANGMTFTRMYTEPSCTPTRTACLTGRHYIRAGMMFPIFPIHSFGLSAYEVTLAEVLDDTYHTGIFEKPHMGDVEEAMMHNQGFDEALFATYNQFAGQMFTPEAENAGYTVGFTKDQWDKKYALDQKFRPSNYLWAIDAVEGGEAKEVVSPLKFEEYVKFNAMAFDRVKQFITKHAKSDKPFYLDWWPNLYEVGDPTHHRPFTTQHATRTAESFAKFDGQVGELMKLLEELGIAENTLVVLMADNGPMLEIWPETGQNGWFRGGKNDFLEGGVRVPAFAYWPGMIKPGQVVGDIVHCSDLFTTFARLGGRMDKIPTDRVVDGIDQTALLLNGDTHGRRDYVFIYQGPRLGAIVKQQYKRHFAGERPGLAGKAFYDLYKDPREEHPMMAQFLWAWGNFDMMKARHDALIEKYPHHPPARGKPYVGVKRLPGKK